MPTGLLPPLKPIPIKERLSIVFVEKGEIDVVDGAFVVVDNQGLRVRAVLTHIPVGGVACIMLEPGTRVSHRAAALAARVGSRPWLTQLMSQGAQLLDPIYDAQLESIRSSRVVAVDETPIKAGRAGPGKLKAGYFWPVYGEHERCASRSRRAWIEHRAAPGSGAAESRAGPNQRCRIARASLTRPTRPAAPARDRPGRCARRADRRRETMPRASPHRRPRQGRARAGP